MDEEMEREPEAIRAEIGEMIKNYPNIIAKVIIEQAGFIISHFENFGVTLKIMEEK